MREKPDCRNVSEIKENTKAYVGPLVPGIFDRIQEFSIEHVYTSFPEGRIRKESVEIGGKDAKELLKEMREKHINISSYAEDMMKSGDFTTQKKTESEILIRLKVGDLGFPERKYPAWNETTPRAAVIEDYFKFLRQSFPTSGSRRTSSDFPR